MKGRRNHLPRKSSPKGIKARQDLRIKGYEKVPRDVANSMHTPGSGNRKKLGRS